MGKNKHNKMQRSAAQSRGPRSAAKVLPDEPLFLSGKALSEQLSEMQAIGIHRIVSCGCEPSFQNDFDYLHVRMNDNADAKVGRWLDPAADFIAEGLARGQGVLVHCHAGICRSPTFICAFLLKYRPRVATTTNEALMMVRRVRACAKPRTEFLLALDRFAARCVGEESPTAQPDRFLPLSSDDNS